MLANYEEAQDSGTSPRHVVKPGLNVRQQRPLLARAAQRRCPQESPLLLGAFSAAAGINAHPDQLVDEHTSGNHDNKLPTGSSCSSRNTAASR